MVIVYVYLVIMTMFARKASDFSRLFTRYVSNGTHSKCKKEEKKKTFSSSNPAGTVRSQTSR